MNISFKFYLQYWIKNSTMAFGTGFVIGIILFMMTGIILLLPFVVLASFLFWQFAAYQYFFGKKRGIFEYAYKKQLLKRNAKKILLNEFGRKTVFFVTLGGTDREGRDLKDLYNAILRDPKYVNVADISFIVHFMISELALKEYDFEKEIDYLKKALSVFPYDFVVNFKLANALERKGLGEDSVNYYKLAIQGPSGISVSLAEFTLSQASRVQIEGPRKRGIVPGLSYLPW